VNRALDGLLGYSFGHACVDEHGALGAEVTRLLGGDDTYAVEPGGVSWASTGLAKRAAAATQAA